MSSSLLDLACDPSKQADIGGVIMQEGIAHVCLVTSSMTIVRAKIEVTIPRKRRGNCAQHDKVGGGKKSTLPLLTIWILNCMSSNF